MVGVVLDSRICSCDGIVAEDDAGGCLVDAGASASGGLLSVKYTPLAKRHAGMLSGRIPTMLRDISCAHNPTNMSR